VKLKTKFPVLISATAFFSCATLGIIELQAARTELVNAAEAKMQAALQTYHNSLEVYFRSIEDDLQVMADNPSVEQAVEEFSLAYRALPQNPTTYLQQEYITDNRWPIGEKDKLDSADNDTLYDSIHQRQHPWFRKFLKQRGYYDVFLINTRGDLVYTVYKENDFGTNLRTGQWKDTGLAEVFNEVMKPQFEGIAFRNFAPYAPSANAPASFIATDITKNGRKIGVLAFQMPIERISAVMNSDNILGSSGKVSLVNTTYRLNNSGELTKTSETVSDSVVEKALQGKDGTVVRTLNTTSFYTAYQPFNFQDNRWALLASLPEDVVLEPVHKLQREMILLSIGCILLFTVVGIVISRRLTAPMNELNKQVLRLAENDTVVDIAYTDHDDEIGDFARSAAVFKQNMIERRQLEEQRIRDQQAYLQQSRDAKSQLARSFENKVHGIIQSVAAAATQLSQTASHMTNIMEKTNAQAGSASSAAQQASTNVQTVASASEEMSSSVGEISSQIQKSNTLVQGAVQLTSDADEHANALSSASAKINEIVGIVAGISENINLLALNATIESARAGEAGKGFAVVANEVKNLANQTNSSISEIKAVLTEMQNAGGNIIHCLGDIKNTISELSEASSSIASAIEEQSITTNDISRNMQQAAEGTQLITENLLTVNNDTMDASGAANEVLAAAEELSRQAETLSLQVQEFIQEIEKEE
jgi:methyl-accepting chemotaxis protein